MSSIHEAEEEEHRHEWIGPMSGLGLGGGMSSRLPRMDYFGETDGGRRRPRGRRGVLVLAACALAAVSCLSFGTSTSALGAVGRQLSALGSRLLSMYSCDPTPYVSPEQARELPPTPLPGSHTKKEEGGADDRSLKEGEEQYIPSHIAMCRELQRRHDLSYGDPSAEDPDAVAARFPPLVVEEHDNVCASWEAPHFHLMEMLSSTFLGAYGARYNVAYRPDCARTRGESHASHGAVAIQRDRNLQYRSAPQLSADDTHLLERAQLDFDTTTIQQILADISLLLDRSKTTPESESAVLALCRGCIQEHDALAKAGTFNGGSEGEQLDGVQQDVADAKAREYDLRMSHVSHECLLYPGGKSGEAAKAAGGNGVALSALRPIVVTLLRHAALDWRRRSQAPDDEGRHGAVVYIDDTSSLMPAKVYADKIPQSTKTIAVLVGPLCGRRVDCLKKSDELVGFLGQLYPSATVRRDIVASTAAAFSRMILSKHLIAPPGTVSALLPALAKPTGTFGAVGESDAYGTSTAHWFGDAPGGPDDGSKVGLAWCVTPECQGTAEEEGEKKEKESNGSKVGLSWGLPGEEDDGAKVGMAWGLGNGIDAADEDDMSKVNLAWGLNLETVEVSDEDVARAEEEGYVLTPTETEELEEKWDRPVELKPEEYWTPPGEEPKERPAEEQQQKAPAPEAVDMSVSHEGTGPSEYTIPGSPGKSAAVYNNNNPTVTQTGTNYGPGPTKGTAVYNTGSHSGFATANTGPVVGCTHVQGRLGKWTPQGTWQSSYPQCADHLLSLNGLCHVVQSLGLGRVIFVGDKLQGHMVRSMHNTLGLGDVDPAAMAQGNQAGLWSKNVHCPRHGRSFELAFAHNDRITHQTVQRVQNGPPQYLQAGGGSVMQQCVNCVPWVQAYVASPVRTFLVACPCASCAPPAAGEGGGNRRGLKGLFSHKDQHQHQERELHADDVESDLERFLQLVRDVQRPNDAVFVRTAAPTYCKGSGPTPDATEIDRFNDKVHDAVYASEWGRTHRGPPTTSASTKFAASNNNPKSPNPKAAANDNTNNNKVLNNTSRRTTSTSAPAYLLDVAPMTKTHPDSEVAGGVDCDAASDEHDERQHHHHVIESWNHMLYASMIELATKEDPNFKVQP